MQGKNILVVDDDVDMGKIIAVSFQKVGARVHAAHSGQEGLDQFFDLRPDLIILDIMMPDMDGWTVCRQIRQFSDVPIIMLSALQQDMDMVRGLDYGADDYITKPFSYKVLLARARAAIRRAILPAYRPFPVPPTRYKDDYLDIDLESGRVYVQGKPISLSATELRFLETLVHNAGRVVTYQEMMEKVWGLKDLEGASYVQAYISHLRHKLGEDPDHPKYIRTEQGMGYRFTGQIPNQNGCKE